jgi:hypothetical protein
VNSGAALDVSLPSGLEVRGSSSLLLDVNFGGRAALFLASPAERSIHRHHGKADVCEYEICRGEHLNEEKSNRRLFFVSFVVFVVSGPRFGEKLVDFVVVGFEGVAHDEKVAAVVGD